MLAKIPVPIREEEEPEEEETNGRGNGKDAGVSHATTKRDSKSRIHPTEDEIQADLHL